MAKELVFGVMRDLDEELKAYNHRWEQVRLASLHLKEMEVQRICCQYELESDEFMTREEKALEIIKASKKR